jgi:hypothetical protein
MAYIDIMGYMLDCQQGMKPNTVDNRETMVANQKFFGIMEESASQFVTEKLHFHNVVFIFNSLAKVLENYLFFSIIVYKTTCLLVPDEYPILRVIFRLLHRPNPEYPTQRAGARVGVGRTKVKVKVKPKRKASTR